MKKILKQYFKFTIERNPWEKVVSFYNWEINKTLKKNPEAKIYPFYYYIRNANDLTEKDIHSYASCKEGKILPWANKIYRFERLDEMTTDLYYRFDIDIRESFKNTHLKKQNYYGGFHWRDFYETKEDIEIVRKRFRHVLHHLEHYFNIRYDYWDD
jgi:hypothetical protein